jgi:hypothetical protein
LPPEKGVGGGRRKEAQEWGGGETVHLPRAPRSPGRQCHGAHPGDAAAPASPALRPVAAPCCAQESCCCRPCRVDDVAPRVDCCTAATRSGATQELHILPVTIVPVTCSVFCLKGEKLAPEAPSPFLLPLTDPFLPATRVDALFAWV